MNKDPLGDIFTDEQEVDPKLLADILRPFVKINPEKKIVIFTTEVGTALPISDKVLLFLVARKALKFKGKIEAEETSPAEIIKETSLKEGSVHPTLKTLKEKGFLVAKAGKYFIPNYQLVNIKKHFSRKEENGT